jgi:hypothetical protein
MSGEDWIIASCSVQTARPIERWPFLLQETCRVRVVARKTGCTSFATVIANFREYDERKVQDGIDVDKYMQTLKHEVFFSSNGTLV